jgi:hypothetical protein
MSPEFLTAIIASGVSLLVATVSFWANSYSTKMEHAKFKVTMQRRFTEKLYEKRMEKYPKGFDITDMLRSDILWGKHVNLTYLKSVSTELIKWYNAEAGFFLSKEALKTYYHLREVLMKEPKTGEHYSKEELQKIWAAKNAFRQQLRADVNLLYAEETLPVNAK